MKENPHRYTMRFHPHDWERLRKLAYDRKQSIQSILQGLLHVGLDMVEANGNYILREGTK